MDYMLEFVQPNTIVQINSTEAYNLVPRKYITQINILEQKSANDKKIKQWIFY